MGSSHEVAYEDDVPVETDGLAVVRAPEGRPPGDYEDRARKLFAFDGDGRLTPETAPAYHAATGVDNEEVALARLQGKETEQDVELPVIERKVVIHPRED
jgi:hypothetical protein